MVEDVLKDTVKRQMVQRCVRCTPKDFYRPSNINSKQNLDMRYIILLIQPEIPSLLNFVKVAEVRLAIEKQG